MKASNILMAGLSLGAIISLSGCASVYVERTRAAEQAAQECLNEIESSKKAPQIMTYNSDSKVETHVQTYPDGASMTVQQHGTNKVTGVDTKVGERPYSCNANGRDYNGVTRLEGDEAREISGDYKKSHKKGWFGF